MKEETKEYLTTRFPKEYKENSYLALINLAEHINNNERECEAELGKLNYQLAELKTRILLKDLVEKPLLTYHDTKADPKCDFRQQLDKPRTTPDSAGLTKRILEHVWTCKAIDVNLRLKLFAINTLDSEFMRLTFPRLIGTIKSGLLHEFQTILLPHSLRKIELHFLTNLIWSCGLNYRVIGEDGRNSEHYNHKE